MRAVAETVLPGAHHAVSNAQASSTSRTTPPASQPSSWPTSARGTPVRLPRLQNQCHPCYAEHVSGRVYSVLPTASSSVAWQA